MKSASFARLLPAVSALALLAACAAPAPPPPPVVVEAPPPAPPPVGLSPRVIELASAYRAYVAHATAISPAFTDGGQVARAVQTGAAYEPAQLLQGAVAYGAVAALQEPEFVAGVRKFALDADQRRTVAYEIMKDPAYAVSFPGSAGAAGLVVAALGEDGRRLMETGRSVKQAAYDVQRAAWSKADIADRDARLALAKQLSTRPGLGEVSETTRLQLAVGGGQAMGLSSQIAAPPYTPVVVRSLAVAALAALGYASEASLNQVMPILTEVNSANCLSLSKLNLYQCLAVARPHYEDVFCVGQHILMDTGRCLMKGAGVTDPQEEQAIALAAQAVAARAASTTARPYKAPPPPKPAPKKKR